MISQNSHQVTAVSPVPQQNLTTDGFQKVSKANPCPLCGKPDWCKVAPDDTVMCSRTDVAPIGWKRIKTTADGHGIFKLESALTDRATTVTRAPKKQPVSKPAPIPEGFKLLRLPAPAVDCPQPQKPTFVPEGVPNHATRTIYSYNKDKTQLVHRFEWVDATNPKGRDKTYRQSHVEGGETIWTKGESHWGMYRGSEVFSIATDQPKGQPFGLLILEGEPNVELARSIGLAAVTFQGSNWKESEMETELAFYGIFQKHGGVPVIVQMRDNDDEGIKKAEKVRAVCAKLDIPYVLINPVEIYPEIPDKGDIKEILDAMEPLEFIRRLEEQIHAVASGNKPDGWDKGVLDADIQIPDTVPDGGLNFLQKAVYALYSEIPYVAIAGILHEWTGTHYEPCEEAVEKQRINLWLNKYTEKVRGELVHNRANPESVEKTFKWVIQQKGIRISEVNAGGLNCANGVLKINDDGTHELIPHNPDRVYTYVGCEYDPAASAESIYRLLMCLDECDREIFLRTAAACLNVPLVRMKIGRKLKGLLCYGDGSNGKDTLRTVLAAILGRGMTGKSLMDFKQYDSGRKFPLAGLEGAIVNWASENTDAVKLDSLQSLKQAITGDELDSERKGKDSYSFKPNCVLLFNCNKLPSITGGMEAITSRYSIVKFSKTFKTNPNLSRGELKADPRFKEDPQFVSEVLAPALLNLMLDRLPKVLTEGIDHSGAAEAMREAQEESRHLWGFVRDVNLEERLQGRVPTGELWEELKAWYLANGWLEIEYGTKYNRITKESEPTEKEVFQKSPNSHDNPVEYPTHLYSRLKELFPKLNKGRTKNERYFTLGKTEKMLSSLSPTEISKPETIAVSAIEPGDSTGDSTTKKGDSKGEKGDSTTPIASQLAIDFDGATKKDDSSDLKLAAPSPNLTALSPVLSPPSNEDIARVPEVEDSAGDSDDSTFAIVRETEISQEERAESFADVIRVAIRNYSRSMARETEIKLAESIDKGEVTREAVYRLFDYSNTVGMYEELLKSVAPSSPTSEAETETVSEDVKLGDRVEVVGSTIGHYNGVKGEVIDVFASSRGIGYTVQFDAPVGGVDRCDFYPDELKKLE
jgi:putative DNA primase/helicase